MTHCIVEKKGSMKTFFWLSRFCRMPSATETVERFNSSTPSAMPFTYSTTSGRLPWALASAAGTVTSSAMAKWLFSGCFQSISQTVCDVLAHPGFTFTP